MVTTKEQLKKFNNVGIGIIEEDEKTIIFFKKSVIKNNIIEEIDENGFISISYYVGIEDVADDLLFISLDKFKTEAFHIKFDENKLTGKWGTLNFKYYMKSHSRYNIEKEFGSIALFFLEFNNLLNKAFLKVERFNTKPPKKRIFND